MYLRKRKATLLDALRLGVVFFFFFVVFIFIEVAVPVDGGDKKTKQCER
jgi:hypothetical protein